jgi:hypothetical protein
MAKELRTAEQLSDMIVGALGISEVDVCVRKDHAFGWQPNVISSPGDSIGYQRRLKKSQIDCDFTLTCGNDVSSALRWRSFCSADRG